MRATASKRWAGHASRALIAASAALLPVGAVAAEPVAGARDDAGAVRATSPAAPPSPAEGPEALPTATAAPVAKEEQTHAETPGAQPAAAPARASQDSLPPATATALQEISCAYADTDSGPLAGKLCWLDFSAITFPEWSGERRTPIRVGLGNLQPDGSHQYTLYATLIVKGAVRAHRFPTYTDAFLGNNSFYTFSSSPGARPALYQRFTGTSPLVGLADITVTDNVTNQSTSDYSIVVADAESTDQGESLTWTTRGGSGLVVLPNDPQNPSSPRGNACSGGFTMSADGTRATCEGAENTRKTGTAMLYASPAPSGAPWDITQQIGRGRGLQAVAFAIMVANAQVSVNVTERASATDDFTATLSSAQIGDSAASTQGQDRATTGPRSLLLNTTNKALVTMGLQGDGDTDLSLYRQDWVCKRDGVPVYQGGAPPPSPLSVSAREDLRCTVTLTPTRLTLGRELTREHSPGPEPTGWPLDAEPAAGQSTTVSGTDSASAPVQPGAYRLTSSAPGAGYVLSGWTCTAPSAGGGTTTVLSWDAESDGGTDPQVSVPAGTHVSCAAAWKDQPASLKWAKTDATTSLPLGGTSWTLTGPAAPAGAVVVDCQAEDAAACVPAGSGKEPYDVDPAAGSVRVTGLAWGSYSVTEKTAPAGYLLDTTAKAFPEVGNDSLEATLPGGAVANKRATGTVSWKKVDADSGRALGGSTWTLTGGAGLPDQDVVIADCQAEAAAACAPSAAEGQNVLYDADPAPGAFLVAGLVWSGDSYFLEETDPPVGYVRSLTQHEFTISKDGLSHTFTKPFANEKVSVPRLPLTGGVGADRFLALGGAVAVLALLAAAAGAYRKRA